MGPKGSLRTGHLAVAVTFSLSPLQVSSLSPSKTDNCITFPTSPDADPVLHVCRHTPFCSSQLLPFGTEGDSFWFSLTGPTLVIFRHLLCSAVSRGVTQTRTFNFCCDPPSYGRTHLHIRLLYNICNM